jgi:hypothetical protein
MMRYFDVDEFGNVKELAETELESGEIRHENDQFHFDLGTGISAVEITVNDWFVGSLTDRVRVVARMANAAWADLN